MNERDDEGRRRARVPPWLLLGPGLLFLFLFFFFPLYTLFRMSLSERRPLLRPGVQLGVGRTTPTRSRSSATSSSGRSSTRAIATLLALLIAYPLAYVIAFRGGRYKNLLLGLVVVPFFTNFLIRTLAWKTILGDQGWSSVPSATIGILGDDRGSAAHAARGHRRADVQLPAVHGAADLRRAREDRPRPRSTRRVTSTRTRGARSARSSSRCRCPVCSPGSLLVFIPAAGDFVNATTSASAKTTMIGNVVQNQFLVQVDYPVAAALSFVFMAHRDGARDRLRPPPRHRGPDVSDAGPERRPSPQAESGNSEFGNCHGARGRVGRFFVNAWPAFALLYLFVPIFVIVLFSFNEPDGPLQRRVAAVHPRQLAAPVRRPAPRRRAGAQPADRGDRDSDRDRSSVRSSRSRSCATGSGAASASTSCWCCR